MALTLLSFTLGVSANTSHPPRSDRPDDAQRPGGKLVCGYDPNGAANELSVHRLNSLRLRRHDGDDNFSARSENFGSLAEDIGDCAVIEDDGSIIVPPAAFTLKKSSVLFTPDGDGYRISNTEVPFDRDFGARLDHFLGADNKPGDADNGYRDVSLGGSPFPFYGSNYDTIYIGTNGYITFTQGDTSARLSPAALASELPRIAPLWADLEVVDSGDIYYHRLEGRHVVTWDSAAQPSFGGISTFQAVLYDDGRIAFVYRKVKAQASLVGISPGHSSLEPLPVDFAAPTAEKIVGPVVQTFAKQQRLDLPALLRTFYRTHTDTFDMVYVFTEFPYDNGLGVAHSFNIRNDISGIGLRIFDRGQAYGSPARLSSIITMGNEADWPNDPQKLTAGLNTAIAIVTHELGHRWLSYVRFEAGHEVKDDLLGRDNSHWSFLADTRTNDDGNFSSLMEGNSWRESGGGTFTTIESSVNYFTALDQYLMGLCAPGEVGDLSYLVIDSDLQELLRTKSPISGFSTSATRKTTSLAQIVDHEGPRVPSWVDAPKTFHIAFVLLTRQNNAPSTATLQKMSRYREALERYFSLATAGRASLDTALAE